MDKTKIAIVGGIVCFAAIFGLYWISKSYEHHELTPEELAESAEKSKEAFEKIAPDYKALLKQPIPNNWPTALRDKIAVVDMNGNLHPLQAGLPPRSRATMPDEVYCVIFVSNQPSNPSDLAEIFVYRFDRNRFIGKASVTGSQYKQRPPAETIQAEILSMILRVI